MPLIKSIGRKALAPVLGKERFQRIFEELQAVSIAGLNFGEGNHPLRSGEAGVLRYLRQDLFPYVDPVLIFDVGANVGIYTRAILRAFGEQARVLAFEPSTRTFEQLRENVQDEGRVECYNLGFGEHEGQATLFSPAEGSKLASLYNMSRHLSRVGLAADLLETVELTTVDRFCDEQRIDCIHFLKLDVEGHELKVLEGARQMLENGAISALQFEFGAANLESRTFFRDFFDLLTGDYTLYRVLQDGLYPVLAYKETHEVYKRATNYLAVRRALDQSVR